MTKKFNLSVPDELAEKIEARREYLGNLSALFQEAVEEKIRKKEEFEQRLKGDASMEQIVERLKREKVAAETNYYDKGKMDGLIWAKAASYTDLVAAANLDIKDDDHSQWMPSLHKIREMSEDESVGQYLYETLNTSSALRPNWHEDDCFNDLADQWLNGWTDGVYEFWEEVQKKM